MFRKGAAKWLLLTLFFAVHIAGKSQTPDATPSPEGENGGLTAIEVFARIPLDVLDLLRPSTRLDMIDYYQHADSLLEVTDGLGGKTRFDAVAPDYLKVSVTPVSTLEIKILPYNKEQIVMTLYTVGEDSIAGDTQVKFFDAELSPLDAKKIFKAPAVKDFFNLKDSDLKSSDLAEKIHFATIAYSTGPGDTPLTATFTALSTLSSEDRDLLTPLLIPSLCADWKNKYKFK